MDLPFRAKGIWLNDFVHDIQTRPTALLLTSQQTRLDGDTAPALSQARLLGCGFNGLGQVTGTHPVPLGDSDSSGTVSVALMPLSEQSANVKVCLAKWAYTVGTLLFMEQDVSTTSV